MHAACEVRANRAPAGGRTPAAGAKAVRESAGYAPAEVSPSTLTVMLAVTSVCSATTSG